MTPVIPTPLLERARNWGELHRWERRNLGRDLRRIGLTYQEIQSLIPVPKSTLSSWVRDVELTPDQVINIAARTASGSRRGIPVDTQWKRREQIKAIRAEAEQFAIDHLSDPFFVAGVVMYWAEGSKSRNFVDLTNTDAAALRLFITWARCFLDPAIEFELGLHLHDGNDEKTARAYWRRELGLPNTPYGKTYVKPPGTGHRKNQLPQGVCRVRTRKAADNWNRVMVWIDVVARSFGVIPDPRC